MIVFVSYRVGRNSVMANTRKESEGVLESQQSIFLELRFGRHFGCHLRLAYALAAIEFDVDESARNERNCALHFALGGVALSRSCPLDQRNVFWASTSNSEKVRGAFPEDFFGIHPCADIHRGGPLRPPPLTNARKCVRHRQVKRRVDDGAAGGGIIDMQFPGEMIWLFLR